MKFLLTSPDIARIWWEHSCSNCERPVAYGIRSLVCKGKEHLQQLKMEEAAEMPTPGYIPFAGGPMFCGICYKNWLDPDKGSQAQKEQVNA